MCKYNYIAVTDLEYIDISKVRKVNLEYELEKYKKVEDKHYKRKKSRPKIEFPVWENF